MEKPTKHLPLYAASAGMVCLVLDSAAAAGSIRGAMELCLQTLVPNLFALFVISGLLVRYLNDFSFPRLRRILNFPKGTECFFLVGILGGFPVGAFTIRQAVDQGKLPPETAGDLLGLCNHCGPAFIFGVLGTAFHSVRDAAFLFLIQLLSALLVAAFWHKADSPLPYSTNAKPADLTVVMNQAVRSMVNVCAWVIVAAVMIGFLKRWIYPFFPSPVSMTVTGMLELTNGCIEISGMSNSLMKLILCTGFINFGGLSVLLQIQGIMGGIGVSIRTCFLQKLTQSLISVILTASWYFLSPWTAVIPILILIKKAVEIPKKMLYTKASKGGV